jgi:uncharacterized protein
MAEPAPGSCASGGDSLTFPAVFQGAERHEEEVRAGRIVLEIDDAALQTALSLYPNGSGRSFVPEDIHRMLIDFKTTFGIRAEDVRNAIEEAQRTGQPVLRRIIAWAMLPTVGKDAFHEYPILDSYPRAENDPRDVCLFCHRRIVNVRTGDRIAIHHPAEEGQAGISVRDQPIPVRHGRDDAPKAGRNIRVEGHELFAAVDGRLVIEPGFVVVVEELELGGGLSPAIGDVDFVGKILILGDVEAGVDVRCGKDITVRGSIIGSNVHCAGNLLVTHGIIGSEETCIEVEGNLDVAFIGNATVKVWGDCTVRDNVATSTLWCSGKVTMMERRGQIVSGWVAAKHGVQARSVGVEVGTKVRISVGRDYVAEERLAELSTRIESVQARLKQLLDIQRREGPGTATHQTLPPTKRAEIEKALAQRVEVMAEIQGILEAIVHLRTLVMPSSDEMVEVSGIIRADAIIEFPVDKLKVPEDIRGVVFRYSVREERIEMSGSAAA